MTALDVFVLTADDHVVVTVAGELDVDNHEQFYDAALEAAQGPDPLVLDLREVRFIDSTGIGALTRVRQDRPSDDVVRVVPSARVRAALTLTGLTEVFAVHDTVDAALADLTGGEG